MTATSMNLEDITTSKTSQSQDKCCMVPLMEGARRRGEEKRGKGGKERKGGGALIDS